MWGGRGDKIRESKDVGDKAYLTQADQMYKRSVAAVAAAAGAAGESWASQGGSAPAAEALPPNQEHDAAANLRHTIFLSTEVGAKPNPPRVLLTLAPSPSGAPPHGHKAVYPPTHPGPATRAQWCCQGAVPFLGGGLLGCQHASGVST